VSSLAVIALTLGAIAGIGVLPATAATVTDGDFTYSFDPAKVSAGATITGYGGTGGAAVIPATVLINTTTYAVTAVGDSAFMNKALTSLSIGAKVTKIENWAFYGNDLTTVTIPNTVTTIGNAAFRANKLTTATVGTGVTTIGDYAFEGNDLTSLTLGTNVTDIGEYAFFSSNLTKVTIPNNVTTIGKNAFSDNKLTNLTLGKKVTDIGEYAFFNNLLTSLSIPNSVTTIRDSAFQSNGLTTLTMGTGVATIGNLAFHSNNLKTVTIGSGVTRIGDSAFQTNNLSKVTISNSVQTIGDYAFANNVLATLTLGSSVTTIGASAFSFSSLKSVTIPGNVEIIGESAFAGSSQLAAVTLGTSVTDIGASAFENNALTTVTIPSTVETIGANAFRNNDVETVTIPEGVTSIGDYAFDSNELATVSIPSSVTTIGVCSFASNSLTSVSIPSSVTAIAEFAFTNNNLTTVTIPSSVATIGDYAFAGNNTLTTALFLGAPPTTITAAPVAGASFGIADGKKFYYLPEYASEFGATWNGYTAAEAAAFTTSPIPEIRGTAKVGQTLTAHVKKWSPAPTLSYEWKHSDGVTVLGRNATYAPAAADLDKTLTVTVTGYAITATDGVVSGVVASAVSSAETSAVAAGTFAPAPTPLISGTKQVGKILTVDPGDWPDDATFTYLWKRAGVALTGETATKSRYTVVAGDLGKKLSVTVTATIPGYTNTDVSSAATTAVVAGTFSLTPTPTVTGDAQVGETLTAVPGTWNAGATLTYRWKRFGSTAVISTSTDGRYTPVNADIGKTLTVTVTATRTGFTAASKISAATVKVIGSPFTTVVTTISGASDDIAAVGTTLNAVTGVWDPVPTTFTYVWKRTTAGGVTTVISGATKSSYKVVAADLGKTITVTVTGSKTLFATTSVTSESPGVLIGSAT
jgi:hypothetical protein